MKKYSIDRIENGIAVLECEGKLFDVDLSLLPKGAGEGDILVEDGRGGYALDKAETEKIKKELNALQNSLFDE